MKHEIKVWQSEGRQAFNADKQAYLLELEKAQLEESKAKSEMFNFVSTLRNPFYCTVQKNTT